MGLCVHGLVRGVQHIADVLRIAAAKAYAGWGVDIETVQLQKIPQIRVQQAPWFGHWASAIELPKSSQQLIQKKGREERIHAMLPYQYKQVSLGHHPLQAHSYRGGQACQAKLVSGVPTAAPIMLAAGRQLNMCMAQPTTRPNETRKSSVDFAWGYLVSAVVIPPFATTLALI